MELIDTLVKVRLDWRAFEPIKVWKKQVPWTTFSAKQSEVCHESAPGRRP
jgi:hypothetical protein